MNLANAYIIRETFTRNGVRYECTIAPTRQAAECSQFQVVMFSSGESAFASFHLQPTGDGHWLPDNTSVVDPWLADVIGNFIIDNY